jgi:DNA polymerase-1
MDMLLCLRLHKYIEALEKPQSKTGEEGLGMQGVRKGNMYDFYTKYWRPFGDLLVQMESEGMLVDRKYLSEMEKVAVREQEISGSRFRKWASKFCPDACYMNVSSDAQVRQLLFGGTPNKYTDCAFSHVPRIFSLKLNTIFLS